MNRGRVVIASVVVLAILVAVPSVGAQGAGESSAARGQSADAAPVATLSASAKKLAKKARKVAKKALRLAKKADKRARKAQSAADAAQAAADGKLPRTGELKLSIHPAHFVAKAPGTVDYLATKASLNGDSVLNLPFYLPVTVPVDLLGQKPTLESVEYCYDATDPLATIDQFSAELTTPVAAEVDPSSVSILSDSTDRNDATCRTVAATTPTQLGPNDQLAIMVRGDFSGAGSIDVSRVTANFTL